MLTLSWAEVPTEESLSALPDGQLHLLEINRSPQPIRVEVQVIADAGTAERISVALPPFSLAAGTRRSVPVQLDALGLSLNDMRFSGLLLAIARVTPLPIGTRQSNLPVTPQSDAALAVSTEGSQQSTGGTRGTIRRRVSSVDPKAVATNNGDERINDEDVFAPEVYFHRPPGGTVLAYGGAVLRARFRAGDLTGRVGVHTSGGRRICIKWEIGLTDKGKLIKTGSGAWIREDYWSGGAGEPSGDIANPGPASRQSVLLPHVLVRAARTQIPTVDSSGDQHALAVVGEMDARRPSSSAPPARTSCWWRGDGV